MDLPELQKKCAGAELQMLFAGMHLALPMVKASVLLIHSKNDASIQSENMERILAALDMTNIYLRKAGHVVACDSARNQIFEAVANFIDRIELST